MNNLSLNQLQQLAVNLLKQLITIPSFSKEEDKTADVLEAFLSKHRMNAFRHLNNVWARNKHYDEKKPTLLLNSHHDTVKPNKGYTKDPFFPEEADGKIFGLGSNDAGASLVSLLAAFLHFYDKENLQYNLLFAASSEEEISGKNGIEALLPQLGNIECGIVGEPTLMQMAVAERGLMVVDCTAFGKAGHAARGEGENAIYKAMMDIEWLYCYHFEKVSPLLGPVKMSVTSIETENKQHNVVPAQCKFIIDIRVNELYSFDEILNVLHNNLQSEVKERSTRLKSSAISLEHPLVRSGLSLSRTYYGSPTTSDKALMPFQTLKIGPGDSARSHTADEFIFVKEIEEGIALYIQLLNNIL